MSATIAINSLLKRMPEGQIFTTGDLIGVGSRAAIDACLKRLVDGNVILRLARGVFSNGNKMPVITPLELAQIKARAFNKEIYEHASITAQRLGYEPKPQAAVNTKTREPLTFATNGTGSTCFQSVFGTIHLKATSPRKRHELSDEVWEMAKSVWHLGKNGVTATISNRIAQVWGRQSQKSLHVLGAFIPQWVRELFPFDRKQAFTQVFLNLIPGASDELANSSSYREVRQQNDVPDNISLGFALFEPPERTYSADELVDCYGAGVSPGDNCWCPDHPDCICPVFTCSYCMTQPIRNRFSIALG